MLVVKDALPASDLPKPGVGTVGNYDGVHRGQRAILDLVTARARATGLSSMVVTFEPHPLTVLRPECAPPLINTPLQKERLLDAAGVDVVLVVRFTPELSQMPARL